MKKLKKKWFNYYIRLRDVDEDGWAECISCGKKVKLGTKDCQAGHYVPKTTSMTRFDEDNVNIQCMRCNTFLRGNIHNYRQGMIDKYGSKLEKAIWNKRGKSLKYSKVDLAELIIKYKKLSNEIKQIKGL